MNVQPRFVIPFSRLTPATCAHVADMADEVIAALGTWNLTVSPSARLRQAATHLRQVASGSYGTTDDDLLRTARALGLVIDFARITECLEDERSATIAKELAVAFGGNLEGDSADRAAYNIQSQFWIGTLLARAGLRPKVPAEAPDKRPDFLISVDTLECGVEVKRPTTIRAAVRALDDAASQLRNYGRPGIIAVDLSDCLEADRLTIGAIDDPIPARDRIAPVFQDYALRLSSRVKTYTRSNKYARILGLATHARVIAWNRRDMTEPDWAMFIDVPTFPDACGGLVQDQAERIRSSLLRGMADVTGRTPAELA